ncbi:MAG TPA: universal stress protein [bacterium]|nr:universal stress protein [bacterium]
MKIEKNILIAINLNFETPFILRSAASLFREASVKFYILHVVPAGAFSFINKKKMLQSKTDNARKSVEHELEEAGLHYLNYEIFVSLGVAASEILNFSKRIGFKEFVFGSVSFAVAKNSICPVLLIPLRNIVESTEDELAKEPAISLINPL